MKIEILLAAFWGLSATAQIPVAPATIPHITFVDASGAPCSACKLQSFAAGTTTPLATFTDATGTSMNTNPITLDAAGGANIWLSFTSYKFILKNAAGTTIWSVDQVKGGGGLGGVCSTPGAIQIANGAANSLTCDPIITINTTNHTINVGTLPANYVTIGALGTPTTWTFDTTSPATACASINCGSVTSVGLALPSIFTVTGSPVTTSGTLTGALANEAVNTALMGPSTGSAAPPTFRAIAPADLPLATAAAFGAVKCDGTTITCTAGVIASTVSARTCNANGCYQIAGDGTIHAWGTATGCNSGGGANECSASVTFPVAFTTTANLVVVPVCIATATNCLVSLNSISTTGFVANLAAVVRVNGSGGALTGSISWSADGN